MRFGYSLTGKTNHPASAEATGLAPDLKVKVSVSAAKSIVRLGSIPVEPPPFRWGVLDLQREVEDEEV